MKTLLFTTEQALVHDTVRRAGETAIAACRPGTEWHDVHRSAALVVAEGLVELGVLRGSPETLVESGAATLFFPQIGRCIRYQSGTAPSCDRSPIRSRPDQARHRRFFVRSDYFALPPNVVVPCADRTTAGSRRPRPDTLSR